MGSFGTDEERVELIGIARCAKVLDEPFFAQRARDTRQRLQMIGARALRREKYKGKIDRRFVDCVEVDRTVEPDEQTQHPVDALDLAMRHGDAAAQARRAALLAFDERFENRMSLDSGLFGELVGSQLQKLSFARNLGARDNVILGKDLPEFHEITCDSGGLWLELTGLQGRIDPTDVAVGAAVNHIHAAMSSVAENDDIKLFHIKLHHRLSHRHGTQIRGGFGNHGR